MDSVPRYPTWPAQPLEHDTNSHICGKETHRRQIQQWNDDIITEQMSLQELGREQAKALQNEKANTDEGRKSALSAETDGLEEETDNIEKQLGCLDVAG